MGVQLFFFFYEAGHCSTFTNGLPFQECIIYLNAFGVYRNEHGFFKKKKKELYCNNAFRCNWSLHLHKKYTIMKAAVMNVMMLYLLDNWLWQEDDCFCWLRASLLSLPGALQPLETDVPPCLHTQWTWTCCLLRTDMLNFWNNREKETHKLHCLPVLQLFCMTYGIARNKLMQ